MAKRQCSHTAKRFRVRDAVIPVLSFACICVIELLHNHECTGEGCVLCFAAMWANVLLFTCMGIVIVRPILYVLARARFICTRIVYWSRMRRLGKARVVRAMAVRTPLSMGVMLRI